MTSYTQHIYHSHTFDDIRGALASPPMVSELRESYASSVHNHITNSVVLNTTRVPGSEPSTVKGTDKSSRHGCLVGFVRARDPLPALSIRRGH